MKYVRQLFLGSLGMFAVLNCGTAKDSGPFSHASGDISVETNDAGTGTMPEASAPEPSCICTPEAPDAAVQGDAGGSNGTGGARGTGGSEARGSEETGGGTTTDVGPQGTGGTDQSGAGGGCAKEPTAFLRPKAMTTCACPPSNPDHGHEPKGIPIK